MTVRDMVRNTMVDLRGKVIDLLPRLRARWRNRATRVPVVFRPRFDRLLDRFVDDWSVVWDTLPWWTPPVDIRKEERELVFSIDLPGVRPEDVDTSVTCDHLVIRAERREEQEDSGRDYHWIERRYGVFRRAFPPPPHADLEHVRAQLRNGVLEVRVPLHAAAEAKRIPIAA